MVSVAKAPLATDQKAAPTEVVFKPMPAACMVKRTSLQFPSVLTETKLTSCQHGGLCKTKQVPCEPRIAQSKQIWRAKPRASLRKALCEIEAQPRLSREEKGKAPLSVDGVTYATSTRGPQSPLSSEAKLDAQCRVRHQASLASLNQRVLVSSDNFAPLSKVKDVSPSFNSVAYAASVPKDTNKVPNRKARTKPLCSASYLHRNAKIKAPLRAK